MTDLEFDVLDELYFVISFQELIQVLDLEEEVLQKTLKILLEKKWVKCYRNHSEELLTREIDFNNQYQEYYYLATKAGLLAHNGR